MFCRYDIDEISYELTNSLIKNIFVQRSQEITEYFRKMSAGKIMELKEVIDGIDNKCSFNRERKAQIDREYSLNEQKLIHLTNPRLISVLEKEHERIDQRNLEVENEYAELKLKKRELENRISDIEKANNTADVYERITNISNEELTELYHLS